jgi:hypothetical protein
VYVSILIDTQRYFNPFFEQKINNFYGKTTVQPCVDSLLLHCIQNDTKTQKITNKNKTTNPLNLTIMKTIYSIAITVLIATTSFANTTAKSTTNVEPGASRWLEVTTSVEPGASRWLEVTTSVEPGASRWLEVAQN